MEKSYNKITHEENLTKLINLFNDIKDRLDDYNNEFFNMNMKCPSNYKMSLMKSKSELDKLLRQGL